jgi:hypothetical protein
MSEEQVYSARHWAAKAAASAQAAAESAASAGGGGNTSMRPNYSAGVTLNLTVTRKSGLGGLQDGIFTVPSDGYIWLGSLSDGATIYINNMALAGGSPSVPSLFIRTLIPVSAGDIFRVSAKTAGLGSSGFFAPNL